MLVSLLTPTADRREFWPRSVQCFLSQDYPEMEWVIIDNGRDAIKDLVPNDPRIRYIRLPGARLLHGGLMNLCMEHSKGEAAIVWDDDDFFTPSRVRRQVVPLMGGSYDVVGTSKLYYYVHGKQQAFEYRNMTPTRWLAAPAWKRSVWEKHKFDDIKQGADTNFLRKIPVDRQLDLADVTLLVSTAHTTNAAPKRMLPPSFVAVPWEKVDAIMRERPTLPQEAGEKMIVTLMGGLGNQMFQYAFGRSMSLRRNEEVFFTRHIPDADEKRCYALGVFDVPIKFIKQPDKPSHFFHEHPYCFNPKVYEFPPNTVYDGWWQTEKYFEDQALVRSCFAPKPEMMSAASLHVAEEIARSGKRSAMLHVRRTDYIGQDAFHVNLTNGYYAEAMYHIREAVEDPKFFIFSDEPEWCRANFPASPEFFIIAHNKPGGRLFGSHVPGKEHEDLWLMSMCRHAILANSSFSWWGTWLGDAQEGRTVVGPNRWFGPAAGLESKDILPERWIKI